MVAGSLVILFAADALSGDTGEIRGALGAVILGWALYYHFAMESGDGQTVGKKLMKLRVVLANGRPAGMREVAVRTVLRVVDGIGGYIVGLIVMLATGQRRQRLGDLAAGTIVVDASATSHAPPAPVAMPVKETVVDDEPVEDDSSITLPARPAPPATLADLAAPEAPVAPEMRPFDPPTVEDEPVEVGEPVQVVEDEPVEDEPVAPVALVEDEPAAPVVLVQVDEPVEDEPVAPLALVEEEVVEDEPPVSPVALVTVDEPVEDEQVAEEPLPEVSTPSLEELAHDVVAARTEPVPVAEPVLEDEPVEDAHPAEDEPAEDESTEDEPADEPMTLKSVETVSAIDLVMGDAAEDESSEQDPAPEGPAAS